MSVHLVGPLGAATTLNPGEGARQGAATMGASISVKVHAPQDGYLSIYVADDTNGDLRDASQGFNAPVVTTGEFTKVWSDPVSGLYHRVIYKVTAGSTATFVVLNTPDGQGFVSFLVSDYLKAVPYQPGVETLTWAAHSDAVTEHDGAYENAGPYGSLYDGSDMYYVSKAGGTFYYQDGTYTFGLSGGLQNASPTVYHYEEPIYKTNIFGQYYAGANGHLTPAMQEAFWEASRQQPDSMTFSRSVNGSGLVGVSSISAKTGYNTYSGLEGTGPAEFTPGNPISAAFIFSAAAPTPKPSVDLTAVLASYTDGAAAETNTPPHITEAWWKGDDREWQHQTGFGDPSRNPPVPDWGQNNYTVNEPDPTTGADSTRVYRDAYEVQSVLWFTDTAPDYNVPLTLPHGVAADGAAWNAVSGEDIAAGTYVVVHALPVDTGASRWADPPGENEGGLELETTSYKEVYKYVTLLVRADWDLGTYDIYPGDWSGVEAAVGGWAVGGMSR